MMKCMRYYYKASAPMTIVRKKVGQNTRDSKTSNNKAMNSVLPVVVKINKGIVFKVFLKEGDFA